MMTKKKTDIDIDFDAALAAKELGFRLPHRNTPCTITTINQWVKRCGFTAEWFKNWVGIKTTKTWLDYNPGWTARSFAELILEELDYQTYIAAHPIEPKPVTKSLGYKQMPKLKEKK
jgi:hypothetical protein